MVFVLPTKNTIKIVFKQRYMHEIKFMKKIVFLILFFSISFMFSQTNPSGKVEYIVKNNDNFDVRKIIESPKLKRMSAQMKNKAMSLMMETGSFVLTFNTKESIYKQKDSIEKMKVDTRRKTQMSFLKYFGGGSNMYYTNLSSKQVLVQENSVVLEKVYLISYNFSKWKLLNATKKIGNYVCYKAIRNDVKSDLEENKQTVVWYTPEIPVRFGPKLYNGLPGLVLEVNKGKIVILATKIVLNPKEKIIIKKPKKGIKITSYDYRQKIIKVSKKSGFKLN